jgi:hypothetical protein
MTWGFHLHEDFNTPTLVEHLVVGHVAAARIIITAWQAALARFGFAI